MATVPHDVHDLYLAPVLLALDARVDELGELDLEQLGREVALASDIADWTYDLRAAALLSAIGHLIDTHGWDLAWTARGLRVSHGDFHVVLGVPPIFTEYLSGTAALAAHPS